MNYKEIGQKILEAVGGKKNVHNLTHCATRLRFTLADDSKADDEAVKAIDGVVSLAKSGGQYQVVVGSDVPNVYRALEGLLDLDEVSKESSEKQDRTPLSPYFWDFHTNLTGNYSSRDDQGRFVPFGCL